MSGVQAHAGTTPMQLRADALAAAAAMVTAVWQVAASGACAVGTVGSLLPVPNVDNVIAGSVRLSTEIRDPSARRLAAAEEAIRAEFRRVAAAHRVSVDIAVRMRSGPVTMNPALCDAIAATADEMGLPHIRLASGAGHDAQIIAGVAPVGMIFVPSRGGVSHSPREDTAAEHLIGGANVLLRTVLRLAER